MSITPARGGPASELSHTMRSVMGNFATGVSVITARRADGRPVGTTVNSLTSVSVMPPLLLVCLGTESETLAVLRASRRFLVNILAEQQREHCKRFAAKGAAAKPEEIDFEEHPLGLPGLPGSLARIACTVEQIHPGGDHEIVLGEAQAMWCAEPQIPPLLFFRGAYSRLDGAERQGQTLQPRAA